jgi:hypothetical protein
MKMNFKKIQKINIKNIKKDFFKAIKVFKPEQAVLIMGKHIPVEGKENEYKYVMNITENIVPERIDNFINTLTAEIIRLKNRKNKQLWSPRNLV